MIDSNELVIVLEYCGGGDLQTAISKNVEMEVLLSEREIWTYFYQIVDGVSHMHDTRVMHRDIKPANVFISADGNLRLGDLGLGRFFSSHTQETLSLVGTPYYMSPERLMEHPYDFASDIWSLGCLLYELAALQSPFYTDDNSLYTLGRKIRDMDYPPLPDCFSAELMSLVTSMLQMDATKRPSAKEVRDKAYVQLQKFTS
jgi:NIMA (never in mitosis gene a)-related kinase 7